MGADRAVRAIAGVAITVLLLSACTSDDDPGIGPDQAADDAAPGETTTTVAPLRDGLPDDLAKKLCRAFDRDAVDRAVGAATTAGIVDELDTERRIECRFDYRPAAVGGYDGVSYFYFFTTEDLENPDLTETIGGQPGLAVEDNQMVGVVLPGSNDYFLAFVRYPPDGLANDPNAGRRVDAAELRRFGELGVAAYRAAFED